MDLVEGGAAVTKPSDDKEKRKSNHQDGGDLTPKTTWKFVLDWSLFFAGGATSGGAFFGGFSFS